MRERIIPGCTAILFALIFLSIGYGLGQSRLAPVQLFRAGFNAQPRATNDLFAPFWETWDMVHTSYFDQPVDDVALMEGAINGMLAVLGDQHTRYLSPEQQQHEQEAMSGEFQGIGAFVEEVDGHIVIVSPIAGSPAEAAGLQPGDILLEADGVDLRGLSADEGSAVVRGPAGTTVYLVIERDGQTIDVEIVRAVIEVDSVRGEMLDNDVAYVRLSRFGGRTAEELEGVLEELMAQEPAGLILDLRRNPGGGLTTVVEVADQFLQEGIVLVERFGNGMETVYDSEDGGLATGVPMVVLVDGGSASASEVLAGALRDRGRAILIGQTTFGKGTVQTWRELSNQGGIRLTVARWLTPDGVWVNEAPLEPDYLITLPEETTFGDEADNQLQAAVDFLLGKAVQSEPPATTIEQ
ncbi:MAG: PDZ domain-containing protein [Chloroflexi bacterium]|nr:PDZ domain-containing protein [Chloroflexota bacterium]